MNNKQLLETQEKTSSPTPTEIMLVNQGSYGCVFRPELNCDGTIGDPHYVSKIQKDTESIINEITLGKKITQIKKYQYYFAPIENQCFVSIDKIQETEKQKSSAG